MMGTRGKYNSHEADAFSRETRHIVPGYVKHAKRLKQSWWRRFRAKVRIATRQEARIED